MSRFLSHVHPGAFAAGGALLLLLSLDAPEVRAQNTGSVSAPPPARRVTQRTLVQPLRVTAAVDHTASGLGEVIAAMLETALMERGVSIVERQQLDALEDEKKLGPEITNTRTTQRRGKVKGASIAVIGTVTEFGVRESSKGGIALLGALVGGKVKEKELRIKIDAHLTNIATSEMIPGSQVSKEASQKDTDWFGGAGTLFRGIPVGAIGGGSMDEWLSSKAGKAARKVVAQLADTLVAKMPLDTGAGGSGEEQEQIAVEAQGLDGYAAADGFLTALKSLSGVTDAEMDDYTDGVLKATITASAKTIKLLPVLMETEPAMKPLGLKVSGLNKERILVKKK